MPRELGAMSPTSVRSAHIPKNSDFTKSPSVPVPSGAGEETTRTISAGPIGIISRQRDMKFTARWDLCIQIDSPDHGLPSCAASCHYNLFKKAYFAHGVNGAARRKCAVTAL